MAVEISNTLRIVRRFDASPERVFDAWLDPNTAGKWLYATPTGKMVHVEIDARVGGKYRIVRRDDEDIDHIGEYLEIDRPRRLVFTLAVPKFSVVSTRVSIDIVPVGTGCELTLTHEGVLLEWLSRTEAGWNSILDQLGGSLDITALRIVRHFDAAPERIFDAWLDPKIARKWLFTTPTSEFNLTEIDARVGGKWRITDRRNGTEYKALGEYLEIDRPRRLVFSFGMPQFSQESARVIVEIAPNGAGCDLTVTHERLPWASIKEVEQGWGKMFDKLNEMLN